MTYSNLSRFPIIQHPPGLAMKYGGPPKKILGLLILGAGVDFIKVIEFVDLKVVGVLILSSKHQLQQSVWRLTPNTLTFGFRLSGWGLGASTLKPIQYCMSLFITKPSRLAFATLTFVNTATPHHSVAFSCREAVISFQLV